MKITPTLVLILLFSSIFMTNPTYSAETAPSDTPPKLNDLGDDETAVTHQKKESDKQNIQTSQQGEQTEIKVTNNLGTYIVKPNQSVGTSLPGDAQSSSNHAVQWIVKSWGGSKSTDNAESVPPNLQPNPDSPINTTPK